jgi:hypothetical protein
MGMKVIAATSPSQIVADVKAVIRAENGVEL